MNILRSSIVVFLFDFRRSFTTARIACWLVLVLFPPAIFGLLAYNGVKAATQDQSEVEAATQHQNDVEPATQHLEDVEAATRHLEEFERIWASMLFVLLPGVISLLGLLLWATPTVHTELEGKTWIYGAVRPFGKEALLIGKYLSAISWSAVAAWLGLSMSLVILAIAFDLQRPVQLWLVMTFLIALSCIAYGALYSFIGVVMRRRAMVTAVAFTLLFEFVAGSVPALVKKFTVQYRLRSTLATWLGFTEWEATGWVGREPIWQHVAILAAYTAVLLIASAVVLRIREHITADET